VKKRVRRCGGDDVGCEVSAFRSHCSTEILCAMHARSADFEEKVSVRFGRRAGKRVYGMCCLHAPDRAVEASGSEAKTLSDVLEE
jgi:hypothetical protein